MPRKRLLTGYGVARQACRGHEEAALARVPMLFNTNSFGVGPGHHSFGLLHLAARFNHACGHTCLARLKRADRPLPPLPQCHPGPYWPSVLPSVGAESYRRKQTTQSCTLT